MNRACALSVVFCIVAGCARSPYPGYSRVGDGGLYMKLIVLGEGQVPLSRTDSVHLRFRAALPGDAPGSLFSSDRWVAARDLFQDDWIEVLKRLNEGDSAGFIGPAAIVPWGVLAADVDPVVADTAIIGFELVVLDVLMPGEKRERIVPVVAGLTPDQEQALIDSIAADTTVDWQRWGTSRLYFQVFPAKPDALTPMTGDRVTIRYHGSFPTTGQVFDTGPPPELPFSFRLGDPGQVIQGLEQAVHLLHAGGHGIFLIPSEMAFGPGGSSSGVVPPNTPVIYEVELLDVMPAALPLPSGT